MPGKTGRKLKKLIEISDGLFRCNGCTVDEITELLGVTRKELDRAMQTISLCGVPPYDPSSLIDAYIEDDRVYITHVWGLFDRPARLSRDEALSLFLAGQASASSHSAPELESALDKIRAALKPDEADSIDQASAHINVSPETANIMPVLNIIKKSCGHNKVRIEYYTAGRGEFGERVIHPYGLIYHIDQWYCVGHCELREAIRLFRVDRMKTVETTGESFDIPTDFDLDDFRRNKMFQMISRPNAVCLRFAPEMAGFVREKWPGRTKASKNGAVDVTLHVDRLENFISTVLGYGKSVKVVSPPEFGNMVCAAANKTLSLYE